MTLILNFLSKFFNPFKHRHSKNVLAEQNNVNNVSDYSIALGHRVYAVGDIHGCDVLLKLALDKIKKDAENHPDKKVSFIGLGDYIDRGKGSKQVIDLLLNEIPPHFEKIFIKGNHELYMVNFMNNPLENELWLEYGGRETLTSYGITLSDHSEKHLQQAAQELSYRLPETHKNFLKSLKLYHIIDDYLFVHAGVDPEYPLKKQSELILTTIRSKFLNYSGHFDGFRIVHGHTPVIKPELTPHRINLDTGAYLTHNLSVAVIECKQVSIL